VEVSANRRAEPTRATDQLHHLRWDSDADGVGEADLVGGSGHQALDDPQHCLRRHRTFERTAERDADRDRDGHLVGARPAHERQRSLDPLVGGCVLIAAPERVGGGHRVVHLVDMRGKGSLVALLVEDQARVRGAGAPVQRSHDLLGPGHLRHQLGIYEASRLDSLHTGGGESITKFGANAGVEDPILVL
jgi:hypothetical protein